MKFSLEAYSQELVAEMIPLFKRHQAEVGAYQDVALNPDLSMYERSAGGGILRIFTVRQAGKLVGYQVFFVVRHPHSQQSIQANQDIVYIEPAHRRGMAGYKFLKFCSDALMEEGCEVVYQHINAQHDFGPVLQRIGYKLVDLVYGRKKEAVCQLQYQ